MDIQDEFRAALRAHGDAIDRIDNLFFRALEMSSELEAVKEEREKIEEDFFALRDVMDEIADVMDCEYEEPDELINDVVDLVRERDEARAEVERQRELKDYLRTWLSSDELEGLRVKAAEHPLLWEEIHHLKAEVERLREMAHDFEAMREDRDEARAEVEHAYREGGALYEAKIAEREAFRSGAEAMREACAAALMADGLVLSRERAANVVRALPIPEEP